VVIIGDGSFKYVRSTIDDILQIPSHTTTTSSGSTSSSQQQQRSSSLALGLKNRLGMLLNPYSNSPVTTTAGSTVDSISTGLYHSQQPSNQQEQQGKQSSNYQQQPTEMYRKSYLDYQEF